MAFNNKKRILMMLLKLLLLRMTTMWTNFVKFGDPTPPDQSLDFTWEAAKHEDVRSDRGRNGRLRLTFIVQVLGDRR